MEHKRLSEVYNHHWSAHWNMYQVYKQGISVC